MVRDKYDNNNNNKTEDDDERLNFHADAWELYHVNEYWKRETIMKPVEEWSVPELQTCIQAYAATSCTKKYAPLLKKVLRILQEEEIDGSLLRAGGKSYLMEKAGLIIVNKSDKMRLRHVISIVFAAVDAAPCGNRSYWDRLATSSELGQALCDEYKEETRNSQKVMSFPQLLRGALIPYPLEKIKISSLSHLEAANNVTEAHVHVCHAVTAADARYWFKVVSVAPRDDPVCVWSNLIYVRSDLGCLMPDITNSENCNPVLLKDTSASAFNRSKPRMRRAAKRRLRAESCPPCWELLASVDFAQHGSAIPGHWHLNATSRGDLLPHLKIGITSVEQPSDRQVWHGPEDSCPLWWYFLPEGMFHKSLPFRLRAALSFCGDDLGVEL